MTQTMAVPKATYFDLETTGTHPAFDIPLQFAATVFAPDGTELASYNLRGRPLRHVIPSPGALMVTNQRISTVMSNPLSHYELMNEIYRIVEENAPATMIGYNSIKFDEEMLRHSFYGILRPPYATQFSGNTRSDVLKTTKAALGLYPGKLSLVNNAKGKASLKLEDIVKANGFDQHDAHDALGDVKAARYLSQLIEAQCPGVHRVEPLWRDKNKMAELMEAGEPLVEFDWDFSASVPKYRTILPLVVDDTNPNEWICVSLDGEPEKLLNLSSTSLKGKFRSYKGVTPLRCVKVNAMPTVLPARVGLARPHATQVAPELIEALLANEDFKGRVREANSLRKAEYGEPETVWQKLYSGGFYPLTADRAAFNRFHLVGPEEKVEIAKGLSDQRARELAFWLIGSEWVHAMSAEDRKIYEDARRERIMADDEEWMTVPKALREIQKLKTEAQGPALALLDEYQSYLTTLK